MLTKDEILKLETRREIYNFINNYPGLHLREISRRTNIPLGSLRYHIGSLKKYSLIVTRKDQVYKRYFVLHSIGNMDKEIINILRKEIPLRIVLLLLCPGPSRIYKDIPTYEKAASNPEIYEKKFSKNELIELTKYWRKSDHFHLKKHRTTIYFHLKKLMEADLIEEVKVGREIKYKLKDEYMVVAFLIKYKDAFSKKAIDESLQWKRNEYLKGAENFIHILYDIFPHPYHC
jgi:DNA-binding transcriptional ArsR family regulator